MKKREHYDIHFRKSKLNAQLRLVREEFAHDPELVKKIMDFASELLSTGYSPGRVEKYLLFLRKVCRELDLRNLDESSLRRFLANLENENYSYWTKRDIRLVLKKFVKFAFPEKYDLIKDIRASGLATSRRKSEKTLPREILTVEEVTRMAEVADTVRNRALVLTLYETGARIGEFLNIRIGDVKFDDNGAVIVLEGKTGMRAVRVVSCVPALARWVNEHPFREDRNAFLWVGFTRRSRDRPLNYNEVRKILKRLAQRAGIEKDVHPHLFRHSRATELAKVLTEQQLKIYFGWEQDSRMAAKYVHLSGRDLDAAILRAAGIEVETREEVQLKPKKCVRCNHLNDPSSRFCSNCGMPLDLKTALEVEERRKMADEIMNILFQDKEFVDFVKRKIAELKGAIDSSQ